MASPIDQPAPNPNSGSLSGPLPKGMQVTRPNLGARLVRTGGIYFAALNEEGTNLELQFSRPVLSEEQPFGPRKHIIATEEWQPLNLAWFAEHPQQIGTIVITNEEGQFKQTIPTEEERAEAAAKVIEIGTGRRNPYNELNYQSFAEVRPSGDTYSLQSFSIDPVDATQLGIRCRKGQAKYSLTIFPK